LNDRARLTETESARKSVSEIQDEPVRSEFVNGSEAPTTPGFSTAPSSPKKGKAQEAAHKAALVITSRALAMAVSLASVYFYTRHLKADELALSLVAGMLGELFFVFGDFGLGLCLERKLPAVLSANRDDGLAMIGVCQYVLLVTTSVFCIALFALAGPVSKLLMHDAAYKGLIIVAIPYIAAVVLRNFMFSMMRGVNAYGRLSVLSFGSQFLYAAMSIGGYLLWGMRGFLLGAFLSFALPSFYEAWVLRRYLGPPPGRHKFREFMVLSRPYLAERYVNYGFTYADQWAIPLLISPAALATYYVPRNFFDRLQGLLDAFWMVPTTLLSRESARGLEVAAGVLRILKRFFVYVFVPLSIGLLASSYFLIDVLAGSKYRDALWPFAILTIYFLITGAFAASPVGITVLAPPRERLKMISAQNAVYLVALPLLALLCGLYGVALARVVGTAVGTLAAWWLLEQHLKINVHGGAMKSVILPSIVMFIIVAGWQYVHYSRITAPIAMAIGAIVYMLIFIYLVPVEDLLMLERMLPDRLRFLARLGLRLRGKGATAAN
jgi:O-antigen/teichoic acid export membrane protein